MLEENTQCIASALRNSIINLDMIPKIVYQDNGRAFRAKYFTDDKGFTELGFQGLYAKLEIETVFVVLDDIGRESYTGKRNEIAFRIIDTLLNYKVCTCITANPEMIQKLQKMPEWAAILDRLKDICKLHLQFTGESMRGETNA